ncbi:hypothetical protein FUAX_41410 (plasmid) [Fulvitalea axinellae]|uniref:BRCT domain-containing protein n=1 Tax=Fulvitalea axinellae TaxID=1182444 RepID=A0AAU9CYY2_9BACT|nr:hypothetical protein FUAX_41410 [Fulvitalea axinellae]
MLTFETIFIDMDFTTIDFETAIGARWSICQVGLVRVESGKIVHRYSQLVKPPKNEYSNWNTNVHGIHALHTRNSPIFPEIWEDISPYIEGQLLVAHNAMFDVDCLEKTLKYYGLPVPMFSCDCTLKRIGGKLDKLCELYGVSLENHHEAIFDAIACAEIYLKLLKGEIEEGAHISDKEDNRVPFGNSEERLKGDILKKDLSQASPEDFFYDKKVVFTGVLKSIKRIDAAELVKKQGADIDTGISKRTNYVITGKKPGPSKMKQIEKYNAEGSEIIIMLEGEFLEKIGVHV